MQDTELIHYNLRKDVDKASPPKAQIPNINLC
jgi:hypothetical protein